MKVDLHGFELWEALEEIVYKLEECKTRGVQEITFIHGFHRGQALKNYIQSEGFLKEMAKEGFKLKKKKQSKFWSIKLYNNRMTVRMKPIKFCSDCEGLIKLIRIRGKTVYKCNRCGLIQPIETF